MVKYILLTIGLSAGWSVYRDVKCGIALSMPHVAYKFYRSKRPVAYWGVVAANAMAMAISLTIAGLLFWFDW